MYGFVITTAGEAALARAAAGDTLTFDRVAVGKGIVESVAAARALTALLDEVAAASSSEPAVAGGQLSLLLEYRNDMNGGLEAGFNLTEFGIFGHAGDDQAALLYYASLGDAPVPVQPLSEGLDVHRFPVAIAVTGEVSVTLGYPAGAFVTHQELLDAIAEIGVEEALEAINAHIANKNNPHGVTAVQAGALPLAGGTMTGAINMNSKRITNLPAPSATSDPARLADVNTRLPLAGGTMTGNINMNNKRVTNLPAPASNAEPLRRIDGVSNATATALGIAAGSLPDAAFQKLITKVNTAQNAADSVLNFKQIGTANLAGTQAGAITINLTHPLSSFKELLIMANGIQSGEYGGNISLVNTFITPGEVDASYSGSSEFYPPIPNFQINSSVAGYKTSGYLYAIFLVPGVSGILINSSIPAISNSISYKFWTCPFTVQTGIGSKLLCTVDIPLSSGNITVYGR